MRIAGPAVRTNNSRNRETRRPQTTVDATASKGSRMAIDNQLERKSLRGKLARGVFTTLLLILPLASCFAPPPKQGPRPRLKTTQRPPLGRGFSGIGNLTPEQQGKALQSEPGFN